jgi:hypothetical protein
VLKAMRLAVIGFVPAKDNSIAALLFKNPPTGGAFAGCPSTA